MEIVLFGVLPLITGLVTGALAGRRHRLDARPLVIAPFASCLLVLAVLFSWDVILRLTDTGKGERHGAILRSLAGTLMYCPGVFLYGAIPAVAGAALSWWLMTWNRRA